MTAFSDFEYTQFLGSLEEEADEITACADYFKRHALKLKGRKGMTTVDFFKEMRRYFLEDFPLDSDKYIVEVSREGNDVFIALVDGNFEDKYRTWIYDIRQQYNPLHALAIGEKIKAMRNPILEQVNDFRAFLGDVTYEEDYEILPFE